MKSSPARCHHDVRIMLTTIVVTFESTEGRLVDGDPTGWLAVIDELPEFVGHGHSEDEAAANLCEQLNEIVWH
jgi:predicted RNase H-like HicB family nuclease